MDIVTWLLVAALGGAGLVMLGRYLGWRPWQRRGRDGTRLAAMVIAAHGARRCVKAMELLEMLARAEDGAAVAAAWQDLEMPLLEALPDCPPEQKHRLITACEAAAAVTAHRETAKGLMAVRNSLID
jgi:hypothetical protein